MRAVDKFDHRLGWKFGTYAVWWIRQGVTRALSDTSRLVRIPCHHIDMPRQIEQVRVDFRSKRHREPTTEEIAKRLKVAPDVVRSMQALAHQPHSLDNYLEESDDEIFHGALATSSRPGARRGSGPPTVERPDCRAASLFAAARPGRDRICAMACAMQPAHAR